MLYLLRFYSIDYWKEMVTSLEQELELSQIVEIEQRTTIQDLGFEIYRKTAMNLVNCSVWNFSLILFSMIVKISNPELWSETPTVQVGGYAWPIRWSASRKRGASAWKSYHQTKVDGVYVSEIGKTGHWSRKCNFESKSRWTHIRDAKYTAKQAKIQNDTD